MKAAEITRSDSLANSQEIYFKLQGKKKLHFIILHDYYAKQVRTSLKSGNGITMFYKVRLKLHQLGGPWTAHTTLSEFYRPRILKLNKI